MTQKPAVKDQARPRVHRTAGCTFHSKFSLSAADRDVLVDKVMRTADTLCNNKKFWAILDHVLKLAKTADKRASPEDTSLLEFMAKTGKDWIYEATLCRVKTKYDGTNYNYFL